MDEQRNGNFFLMPTAVFHLELCPGELAVYAYLRRCINRDYVCWPSYTTIGNAVGMSKKTVKRYVDSLMEKGLVTAEPTSRFTKDGLKFNGNLLYHICPIAEAEQQLHQRKLCALEASVERQTVAKLLEKQALDSACEAPITGSESRKAESDS